MKASKGLQDRSFAHLSLRVAACLPHGRRTIATSTSLGKDSQMTGDFEVGSQNNSKQATLSLKLATIGILCMDSSSEIRFVNAVLTKLVPKREPPVAWKSVTVTSIQ